MLEGQFEQMLHFHDYQRKALPTMPGALPSRTASDPHNYLEQINKEQLQRYFVKRLERLGLQITLQPVPAA